MTVPVWAEIGFGLPLGEQTCLDMFKHLWTCLDMFGHVWTVGAGLWAQPYNQSSHLGIHKQTNACWSIPRSHTVDQQVAIFTMCVNSEKRPQNGFH